MFAREVHHLSYFGLRYLISIDPTFANSMVMHMQHNSCGSFMILAEEPLQHVHNELHWRVVIVEDEHTIHIRSLGLRLGLGDDGGAWAALVAFALAVVVCHARHAPVSRGGQYRGSAITRIGVRRHGLSWSTNRSAIIGLLEAPAPTLYHHNEPNPDIPSR